MKLTQYDTILSINKVVKACVDCPFLFDQVNNGRREFMWGQGNEILFVGQSPAPSNTEKREGSRFDKFFKEVLSKTEIRPETVAFTNISKATIPPGGKLNEEQKAHCFDHVGFETAHLKPSLVVTLGTLAREWSGNESFGDLLIGKFPYEEVDGSIRTTVVPIYSMEHPASIRYGVVKEKLIIDRLNQAYGIKRRNE